MTWNWYLLRNLSYSLVECLSAEQVGSSADGLRPNAGGEVKSTDSERVKWSGNFNSCLSCHFYLFHMQFGETVNTGGWKQAAYCCTTKWLPWATSAACGHFPVAFISLQCILIPFFFFFVLSRNGNMWHAQEVGEEQKVAQVWEGDFLHLERKKRSVTAVALPLWETFG